MYDMQNIEKISISEMLIIIKSVFRVVSCIKIKGINSKLIDIPDDNLEIYIENTFSKFIQGIVQKLQKESNIPENTIAEGESFLPVFQQRKITQTKPPSPSAIGIKKTSSSSNINTFSGFQNTNEKKYRIFKWKMVEKYKMNLIFVKDKLIESIEVIEFFTLFHPIKTVLFSWGFNAHYQNGIQFSKSIRQYYNHEIDDAKFKRTRSKISSNNSVRSKKSNKNLSQDSIEETEYDDAKHIDVEEVFVKKYPSVSEEEEK